MAVSPAAGGDGSASGAVKLAATAAVISPASGSGAKTREAAAEEQAGEMGHGRAGGTCSGRGRAAPECT